MKRKIKVVYRDRPSIVLRIWVWGLDRIIEFCDYWYDKWPQLFCILFFVLIIARIFNFLTVIVGVIVTTLLYEKIKLKWFTKNPVDTTPRVMDFYPNNWILRSVELFIALTLFSLSIVLMACWTFFLILLLLITFPWCLFLLFF